MAERAAKIRLYVDAPLGAGEKVTLRDAAHYLTHVMRLRAGDSVTLFNGRDGAWAAEVLSPGKKAVDLRVSVQTAPQQDPPDLWLCFAPIKKARTDFIVEKSAEMGAARILPVQTQFTNSERVRVDRLQAHAREAAEQCGGTYVPPVAEAQSLDKLLAEWPEGRRLMFCDEARVGESDALETLARTGARGEPWAILIGPEGGFSQVERDRLHALPFAHPVSLGPRILRADTAVVAAMTVWQLALGDWT